MFITAHLSGDPGIASMIKTYKTLNFSYFSELESSRSEFLAVVALQDKSVTKKIKYRSSDSGEVKN